MSLLGRVPRFNKIFAMSVSLRLAVTRVTVRLRYARAHKQSAQSFSLKSIFVQMPAAKANNFRGNKFHVLI
jgi:hypothetical protein